MGRYHKVIGIDLGTTYSAVSIYDYDNNKIIVIPNPVSQLSTVPSVVGLDPENKVIVGTQAQNNLVMDPANTIIEIKRLMGTYAREPNPEANDPGEITRVHFRKREYQPQEISAFILMELKRMAEQYINEPIYDAVVTVPAYFKEPQKGATADAAEMAHLNLRRLLNEPTAAAVCFGVDQVMDDKRHIYAVYDLGGGTFDVSIVAVTKNSVDVVGTGGDPKLGGGDFDDRITGYALQQIQAKHGVDLSGDPAIWSRIKREAEMRKRELSNSSATMLGLPYLTAQISINIPLSRATFESLIKDLLDKSLTCLDEAIESAYMANAITRDMIEQVLLVGGSTRVACIPQMLADHLDMDIKDIRSDINPDEVVSRGAAIVAKDFKPLDGFEGKEIPIDMSQQPASADGTPAAAQPQGIVLNDVTSHTLGILVNESDFFPLITKDSAIPATQTQGGFTNGGKTNMIDVMIFQGEDQTAFNNTLIGKLPIKLPEVKEGGYYKFQVTFNLDNNGLLGVTVLCLNNNQAWDTKVQCNVRATKQQIEQSARMLEEAMAGSPQGAAVADVPEPLPVGGMPRPPMPTPPPLPVPPRPAAAQPPVPVPQPVVPQPQPQPAVQQSAAATQSATASQPAAGAIPTPPADVPEKYAGLVRRSFKMLSQMPGSDANVQRLMRAYIAFIKALEVNDPDIEDNFDDLSDLYFRCK